MGYGKRGALAVGATVANRGPAGFERTGTAPPTSNPGDTGGAAAAAVGSGCGAACGPAAVGSGCGAACGPAAVGSGCGAACGPAAVGSGCGPAVACGGGGGVGVGSSRQAMGVTPSGAIGVLAASSTTGDAFGPHAEAISAPNARVAQSVLRMRESRVHSKARRHCCLLMVADQPAENVPSHRCEDCAEIYRRVYSFVNEDGAAYAVYNGALHEGHAEPEVYLTSTIGGWGGGDPAKSRSVNLLIANLEGKLG